jgi:hypothetical protein
LVGSPSQRSGYVNAVCGWTHDGVGDVVSSRSPGTVMRGRLGSCCVRWLFQGCFSGGLNIRRMMRGDRLLYGNVPDNACSQGSKELSASAGACCVGSLAYAQGPAVVTCPPRTLLCTPASYILALSRHFKFYLRVVRDRGSNSAQKSLYNFTISEPFQNNSLSPKNLLRGADFFGLYQTLL